MCLSTLRPPTFKGKLGLSGQDPCGQLGRGLEMVWSLLGLPLGPCALVAPTIPKN